MKWQAERGLRGANIDPYFEWAERTEWRGFRRLLGQRLGTGDRAIEALRVLVQAPDAASAKAAMGYSQWKVAEVYTASPLDLRHFVAEVPIGNLAWLKSLATTGATTGLRWELALPFRDAETEARAETIGAYGETREALSFRTSEYFEIDAGNPPGKIKGPVMAVIDFGCPFMNHAFRGPRGTTRIRALWDQGANRTPARSRSGSALPWPWADTTGRMGYGRALYGTTMNKIIQETAHQAAAGRPLDESEAYRRIDYLINYDDARRRIWAATHGSHVTAVAAGSPDPLLGAAYPPDDAARAPVVFVQLPALTAADSGGGSLSAQVLDAVHYVLDVCEPDAPIVVNLSYGSFAGPHDGSSLIEQALDEIVMLRGQNLAIVLGAGNGHQAACHVKRSAQVDRSALLRIGLEPGDFTDTYVETWFDQHDPLLGRVQARARTASGDWSPWVGVGEVAQMLDVGEHRPVARLSFVQNPPNGGRPLLLLAMAPTARPADDDGPLAPVGSWQIEVGLKPVVWKQPDGDSGTTNASDEPEPEQDAETVHFESWVERDDPGWLGVGVQPRFEEQRIGDADQTLSSIATGKYTIAAGGFRLSDAVPAHYSSTGPRKGPALIYAACEESADQPNISAAAVRSSDSLRMNGTSVAAPVLARRIYNHFASNATPDVAFDAWPAALRVVVDSELTAAAAQHRASVLRHDRPAPTARAPAAGRAGPAARRPSGSGRAR